MLILILFVIFSAFFIMPKLNDIKPLKRASSLQTLVTDNNNKKRTDYIDENGNIAIAADMGYATKIVIKEGNEEIEEYYSENGERVKNSSGYYGIYREYDNNGYNITTTYLNLERKPVLGSSGYATIKRTYDKKGNAIVEYFFDVDGNPIRTPSYGYGRINDYNEEGQIEKITYINASGIPLKTELGYASVVRSFYSNDDHQNGKIESEFYYDEKGDPVALSLGQYGVNKKYDKDGQISSITYLGADGKALQTTEGYTTVKRTYYPNNYVATEQYYDIMGNPYALSEGQYGIKRDRQLRVWFLNANGDIQFNVRKLLYNNSLFVILFASFIVILSMLVDKRLNIILLVVYMVCVGYITLMFREGSNAGINLEPLWSYRQAIKDRNVLADILRNIWMFIPLGAILYNMCPRKRILVLSVLISISIETIQYFTGTGLCEFDDVVSNSLGAGWGYGINLLLQPSMKKIKQALYTKRDNRSKKWTA